MLAKDHTLKLPSLLHVAQRDPPGLKTTSFTWLRWPLTRRVLAPSAQLTYQSVPAAVPTTPMSMLSWKTALTTAPSRVSSPSRNTEPPDLALEPLRLSSGTAPTAHRRSRLVLLPLTSRSPPDSSTPPQGWALGGPGG